VVNYNNILIRLTIIVTICLIGCSEDKHDNPTETFNTHSNIIIQKISQGEEGNINILYSVYPPNGNVKIMIEYTKNQSEWQMLPRDKVKRGKISRVDRLIKWQPDYPVREDNNRINYKIRLINKSPSEMKPVESGTFVLTNNKKNLEGTFKWMINMGPGCILDNKKYLIYSHDMNKVYCIKENGAIKWSSLRFNRIGSLTVDYKGDLVLNETIFQGKDKVPIKAIIRKIDGISGKTIWIYSLENGLVYSKPTINKEGIIFCGTNKGVLIALSSSGEKMWSFQTDGWIRAAASIAKDNTIYVTCTGNLNYLYALDPAGTLKWKYKIQGLCSTHSPVNDADGNVYVSSKNGILYAIDKKGKLKWRYKVHDNSESWGSVVISENRDIYCWTNDIKLGDKGGKIYCLMSNGEEKWNIPIKQIISSMIIDNNGIIYFGSYKDTGNGNINAINSEGSSLWSHPCFICPNYLKIDKRGTLYCTTKDVTTNRYYLLAIRCYLLPPTCVP